ncbi:MAG: carbohydrate-binding domain-containing protein [Clostridia bacterium]|nr:carbohydrate-binding domain-containing protein [Clostridia bacterium]
MKKSLSLFLIIICLFLFVSCEEEAVTNEGATVDTSFAKNEDELFTDRDKNPDYSESDTVYIELRGDSAYCSSPKVSINGSEIIINSEGIFSVSGSLDNGTIKVASSDDSKVQIVLDGASIQSSDYAPIYVLSANKVFITLAEGSENSLSSTGTFVQRDENTVDAAIFSKQDLTLNGSGSLNITSTEGHGITCKDDLVLTGGVYDITCAYHAFDANNSIRISDIAVTADAGKDGLHCENNDNSSYGYIYISNSNMDIEAEGDGISAGESLQIESGSFHILCAGGYENGSKKSSDSYGGFMGRPGSSQSSSSSLDDQTSSKGLKAVSSLLINGGSFNINTADDAVHSNSSVVINSGDFTILSGDDGFHADETLQINAGSIDISESYEGLEGLNITIMGGEIKIVSSDDGINAAGGTDQSGTGGNRGGDRFGGGQSSSSNGSIVISGGSIYMNASGDGIDANGTLLISGGYTVVCGPTSGDTSVLDYDVSGTITGGTFIGTGAYQMAQTFSDSEQGVFSVSTGTISAQTPVTLTDTNGNTLFSFTPSLSYAIVILSSPDLKKGESYTITVGDISGTFEAS